MLNHTGNSYVTRRIQLCHTVMYPAGNIMHILHGFKGDILEYQPRGDTEALVRYVT